MRSEDQNLMQRLAVGRGKAIREAREVLGWSQAQLAEKANTTQQTVDRLERGVVEHSRAYPKIASVLGIPNEGFDPDRFNRQATLLQLESNESYKRFMEEGRAISLMSTEGRVPVLSVRNRSVKIVDAIARGFPVEHAEEAFAVRIFGQEMEPVLRPGDTVIANPIIPPLPGCELCLIRDEDVIVRTLLKESPDRWVLKAWNPAEEISVPKSEALLTGAVVARISRSH
ncbi:transcriptional regulator with XRE-family HTH domain [Sinorhizobium fredii]|uniref:XRE family transcriptional regulator n=1 Tax=Rhizobium fredii TaxID=380 RepID=UPI00351220DF